MRRIVGGVVALTARRGGTVPFTMCRACGMREDRWHADDCPVVVEAVDLTSFIDADPGNVGTQGDALCSDDCGAVTSGQAGAERVVARPAPRVLQAIVGGEIATGCVEPLEPSAPPPVRPRPVKIDPTTIPSAMEQRAAGWGR